MTPNPAARQGAPSRQGRAWTGTRRWPIAPASVGLWLAIGLGLAASPALAATAPSFIEGSRLGAPPACSATLQSLVDATATGTTLDLPACVYRGSATITRPLAIRGTSGTEVRGSDIWTAWAASGARWVSAQTVPPLQSRGECRPLSDRCHQPEQVFVDGLAQARVSADPAPGEFALTGDRHVILGSDPAGHLVEVTTRSRWLDVSASGVSVEGMTFRHAANGPQADDAALRVLGNVDGFRLEASHLFEAHGTLLGIVGGSGHRVFDSELARAGEQGFAFAGTSDTEIRGSTIRDNNLDGFDPKWEAGAGKAGRARGLTLDGNVIVHNGGPGIWCDIDCQSVSVTGNRVADNEGPGILFEISTGATVTDNTVTENGWGNPAWGWGGGIVISSSGSVDVGSNTLAWNADGISVISQARGDRPPGSGTMITVHDNTVLASPQPTDLDQVYLVAWLQDWAGPLYLPESGNRGWNNRYWSSLPESSADRFAWTSGLSSLDAFRGTPAGTGDRYLTVAEKDAIVAQAELSPMAEVHEVSPSLHARIRQAIPILIVAGVTALIALIGYVTLRRRTR